MGANSDLDRCRGLLRIFILAWLLKRTTDDSKTEDLPFAVEAAELLTSRIRIPAVRHHLTQHPAPSAFLDTSRPPPPHFSSCLKGS